MPTRFFRKISEAFMEGSCWANSFYTLLHILSSATSCSSDHCLLRNLFLFLYISWSQACPNLLFNKLSCRILLKRCTTRWDRETPRRIQKIEKLVQNPLPLYSFQFDTECNSLSGDRFKTDGGLDKKKIKLAQTETRIAALCEESVISHEINTDAFESGNEAVSSGCSCQINLDVNNKTSSTLPEIGQDPTYAKIRLENSKEIKDTGKHLSGEFEVICDRMRYHVDHNLFYLNFR